MFMMRDTAEIRGLWPQGWEPLAGGHRRGAGAPSAYKLVGNLGGKGTGSCRGTPRVLEKTLWSFLTSP